MRDDFELSLHRLQRLIRWTNRDASVICHPDDERIVREALAQIPADLRPAVVVSVTVPKPGTAFYSRPLPLDEITGSLQVEMAAPGDPADDRTPLTLPDGKLLNGEAAAAYRQTSRRIAARLVAREAILRDQREALERDFKDDVARLYEVPLDFLNDEPTKGNQ